MAKKNRDLNRTERAKALRAKQERAERNRKLGTVAAVIVAVVLIATALFWTQRGGSDDDITVNDAIPAKAGDHSLVIGPDDAKHKVVVWEDFLCPYCREFEEGSRDMLHAAAEKGTVQVEYRPFQLLSDDYSKESLAAFVHVLEEGTPNEALALHDILFENQPYENGRKPDADKIAGWVGDLGLDEDATKKAIESGQTEWLQAAKQAADEAGVQGTPTITVDGKPLQGTSISDMVNNLEQQLGE